MKGGRDLPARLPHPAPRKGDTALVLRVAVYVSEALLGTLYEQTLHGVAAFVTVVPLRDPT
jgi:hypothetical protein